MDHADRTHLHQRAELTERGFVVLRDVYETPGQAWEAADQVLRGTEQFGPLEVVADYTVLYVDSAAPGSTAATRIVLLASLAAQRNWPEPPELATRLRARMNDPDAAEGILARIVEAADETTERSTSPNIAWSCNPVNA